MSSTMPARNFFGVASRRRVIYDSFHLPRVWLKQLIARGSRQANGWERAVPR